MYLITEQTEHELDISLVENETSKNKNYYLSGVFASADVINKNNRTYPKNIMEAAVSKYQSDFIDQNRSIGEINHPGSPTPNPRMAAIMIESLSWKGNDVVGKARVMTTPEGKLLSSLLESGYKVGISTRATGSVSKNKDGIDVVQNDFQLFAIDVVHNPSNTASMVEGIFENEKWKPMKNDKKITENDISDDITKKIKAFCRIMASIT